MKIRRFLTTGSGDAGTKLRAGMVLAIEPMVNVGKPGVQVLSDGWTAVTEDGSLSAHFEHTVAVTAEGAVSFDAVGFRRPVGAGRIGIRIVEGRRD